MAPGWRASLKPLIPIASGASDCTGDAFHLITTASGDQPAGEMFAGRQIKNHVRLSGEATSELIDLLNLPDVYWPVGSLCTCCPVVGVRIVCGTTRSEVIIDPQCGWVTSTDPKVDERALSGVGRFAFTAVANELFPELDLRLGLRP